MQMMNGSGTRLRDVCALRYDVAHAHLSAGGSVRGGRGRDCHCNCHRHPSRARRLVHAAVGRDRYSCGVGQGAGPSAAGCWLLDPLSHHKTCGRAGPAPSRTRWLHQGAVARRDPHPAGSPVPAWSCGCGTSFSHHRAAAGWDPHRVAAGPPVLAGPLPAGTRGCDRLRNCPFNRSFTQNRPRTRTPPRAARGPGVFRYKNTLCSKEGAGGTWPRGNPRGAQIGVA